MKRFSITVMCIALSAILAHAQKAQNDTDEQLKARNAPGVFIFSASAFGPDKNGDSHFTIEVGNIGTKTIAAIEWEYYRSGERQSHYAGVEKFHNDKLKLRPEQRAKLTQPVHRYSDDFVKGFNLNSVRIISVEFADGSSWQRPADTK